MNEVPCWSSTQIDPDFNLSSEPLSNGCWCLDQGDRIAFRNKALILPSVRLSYDNVEDFKILGVIEGFREVHIDVIANDKHVRITFRYFGLYRMETHL